MLEHAATLCALRLQRQCEQQQAVMAELEATREQVLHAERLVAVGGFCRSLSARLVEHLDRLRALEASLRALPADPRRTDLLDHTVQNVRAVDALLADLLERARGSAAPGRPILPLSCAPDANTHDQHQAPRGTPT